MERLQPKLRFKEFKDEWFYTELQRLSNKIGDGLHGTPEYVDNSDIIFINGNNLINGRIKFFESSKKVNINTFKKNDKNLNHNSILISLNGTIGSVAKYNGEKVMLSKSVGYINFTENAELFFHLLRTNKIQRSFESNLTGSTIKNLSLKTLRETKIIIPTSKEEQAKIANFLTSVDEKLNLLIQKKEALEEYKKGMMQKIFSQEIRFKDENGEDFEEWEEKRLGEVGDTYNGLSGKSKDDFVQGKPYIQYKQIFDDSKIDISRFQYVSIKENDKQNKVKFGDAFFTVSSETPNEIGTASVLLDNVDDLYLNSFCFGYRANSMEQLNPYFSRFLFRSPLFRTEIVKLAQGSTRFNMSKIQLLKIKVLLPSRQEQIKIATFLSAIDEKIELVSTQIEETKEYKKGLLQGMFC